MKLNLQNKGLEFVNADLLVIGMFEKDKPVNSLDKKLNGMISKSIAQKKFEGEFKQTISIFSLGNLPAEKVLIIGLGKKEDFNLEKLRKVCGFAAKIARDSKSNNYVNAFVEADFNASLKEKVQAIVEGTILGAYQFTKYKTEKKDLKTLSSATILCKVNFESKEGLKRGQIIAETIVYVRDLVNMPACDVTPKFLTSEAKKAAKKYGMKFKVFGKKELTAKKMNAILRVSAGSSEEPQLIMLETNPRAKKKIALVGKGITFDSGGLDIKPPGNMLDMKSDMAGAATVLGAAIVAARLKFPINVLTIMAASENMTGSSAQKPGDIFVAYNKKTIEIMNTDAEGRLVLADAVAYAEEQKPAAIIDIATLTGASVVVLGYAGAPFLCNNEKLRKAINVASEETQERLWELPLWDDFRDAIKGDLADVRNIGKGKGYEGGMITAGTFIESFIKNTPWLHIDIGGAGWFIEDQDYISKGGTGYGVRLFTSLIENWK